MATVHNINTTINYDTIQAAIDAPETLDGYTVLVEKGIYYENVLVIKSILLIGKDLPILRGGNTSFGFMVLADSCRIEGFSVLDTRLGMHLSYCVNTSIVNNYIHNSSRHGIYLNRANSSLLERNFLLECGDGVFIEEGYGN
ncbi:MAG: NosD domain-containing protein [Candidatus Bathyarchaeota archaeon]